MMAECEQHDKPRILMVGFAVSGQIMDDICRWDRVPPVQTYKNIWSLIDGVETSGQVGIDLLSSLPITNYPSARKIFVGWSHWDRETARRMSRFRSSICWG